MVATCFFILHHQPIFRLFARVSAIQSTTGSPRQLAVPVSPSHTWQLRHRFFAQESVAFASYCLQKKKKNSVKYPNCLDSSYQGACDCWIISIIIIDIASLIFRNRPLYSHYLLWLTRGVQYGWPNTRVLMYECTYSLVDGLCLALALVVSIFRIFSSRHFRHIQKLLCCRFFLFFFFLLSHWRDSRVVASASSLMWYLVCQFL